MPAGGHVSEENTHAFVLGPDVPVDVGDFFGLHFAVGTLESRPLAAAVAHVPAEVRLPREAARAIRAAELLGLVPPHEAPAR